VLIAADHDATRTGMRLALEEAADISEADDTDAAVSAAVREQPDICMVDFSPASRGIRTAAEIVSKLPDAAVVVLTEHIDADEFLAAVHAGATGYLSQQIDPSRLPDVVRGIMRGEAAVPRALVARLIDEIRGGEQRRFVTLPSGLRVALTMREWQVVDALRKGMTTRDISESLGIAEVTVRRHISGVHHKLGARDRAELLELLGGDGGR
jgi:DNA-binding NarL/FixJ family response regulator